MQRHLLTECVNVHVHFEESASYALIKQWTDVPHDVIAANIINLAVKR